MGSPVKKTTPRNETVQPDLGHVRRSRIEKLEWLLKKATDEDNYGLIKKFTKEVEIQKCYLQIEAA